MKEYKPFDSLSSFQTCISSSLVVDGCSGLGSGWFLIFNNIIVDKGKKIMVVSSDLDDTLNNIIIKKHPFEISLEKNMVISHGAYCVWNKNGNFFQRNIDGKYAQYHIKRDHFCSDQDTCSDKLIKIYTNTDLSTVHIYMNGCDNVTEAEYLNSYYSHIKSQHT